MLSPTTPLKLSVSQSQTSLLYSSPSPPYSPSNPLFSYKNSKPNMCCWKTRAVYYFFIPAKMIQSRLANSLRRCGFDKRNAIWRAAEGKQSGIYLSAAEAVPYILAIHFFFFLHHADTICCVTLCVCVCVREFQSLQHQKDCSCLTGFPFVYRSPASNAWTIYIFLLIPQTLLLLLHNLHHKNTLSLQTVDCILNGTLFPQKCTTFNQSPMGHLVRRQ